MISFKVTAQIILQYGKNPCMQNWSNNKFEYYILIATPVSILRG